MSCSAYPRVLVINHSPFNRRTCNGITLSNLFAGWPSDRLAEVVLSPEEIADDVCSRHFRVTRSDILNHLVWRQPQGGPVFAPPNDRKRAGAERAPFLIGGRQLRVPLGELVFRLPLSDSLWRWVRGFAPEVCFSLLGTATAACVTTRVSRHAGVPIVPFFTDDWPSTLYKDLIVRPWLRRSLRHWLRACLERAPLRLVISDQMAEEYLRRYGGSVEVMGNCVSATDYPEPFRRAPARSPLRLVYAGGLYLDRWQGLVDIGQALADLGAEGLDSELLVYTGPDDARAYRDVLASPPVRLMGWLPPEQLPRLLTESDVNVHVESFAPRHTNYTRLSLSTKIPQLLMAGRCILAYGPTELASMRHVAAAGAGIEVGRHDPQALRAALRCLLTDQDFREKAGASGRRVAVERHEAAGQRERMRQLLAVASSMGVPNRPPRCCRRLPHPAP